MFKSLELKKAAIDKIQFDRGSLFKTEVEGHLKALPPGEWILLKDVEKKRIYLGFANPLVEDKYPAVQVLTRLSSPPDENTVEKFICEKIEMAVNKRAMFQGYEGGSRLFFGEADGLPGLIVDSYEDTVLIQVNTAGIDKWRTTIRELLEKLTQKKCFFLDHPQQRSREVLPHYREELPFEHLSVLENQFKYKIPAKNLQKNGWYYDHRENRSKFENAVKRWTGAKEKGLDLFCYGGAWGLHALRAGVKEVWFVDQAPLNEMVSTHLALNLFNERGFFERKDVFDWLDDSIKAKKMFDVIVSDPPAFAKSPKDTAAAIEGYKKLHKKVLKITNKNSLIAFASCTHYVDYSAFLETIQIAARQEGRAIQILEQGMQGWDHPVRTLNDKANYIKYVLVRVE